MMRIRDAEAKIASALMARGAEVERVRTIPDREGEFVVTVDGHEIDLVIMRVEPVKAAVQEEIFPLQTTIEEVI